MRDAEEERKVVGQRRGIATMTGERSMEGGSKGKQRLYSSLRNTKREGRTRARIDLT